MSISSVPGAPIGAHKSNIRSFLKFTTAIVSVVFLSSLPAYAQDADPVDADADPVIDQITIVGERLDQRYVKTLETPAFSVAVTPEQIEATNAFSVEDTFKYSPNLHVRKRYIGDHNATLSFRGAHVFQTPRALVMVDGFVISNFLHARWDSSPKWGAVAPGDIERVEIIYGPASARYSGNALGGAILLQTAPIKEVTYRATAQVFNSHFDYYASDLSLNGWSMDLAAKGPVGPGALSFGYRRFENEGQPQGWRTLRSGSGVGAIPVTGAVFDDEIGVTVFAADSTVKTVQDQFRLSGNVPLNDTWTVRGLLNVQIAEDGLDEPETYLRDLTDSPVYEGLVEVDGEIYRASGMKLQESEKTEMLAGLGLAGELRGFDIDLAFTRFDVLEADSIRSNSYSAGLENGAGRLTNGEDVGWTTADLVLEQEFGGHAIAFGGSFAAYKGGSDQFNTTAWRGASDPAYRDGSGGETSLAGIFVEDAITLSEAYQLTLGLRAESWKAYDGWRSKGVAGERVDQSYEDRDETSLSPKAALTWMPRGDWEITGSIAGATRYPVVGELFQGSLDGDGNFDPNSFDPDLKPESAIDYNLLIAHRMKYVDLQLNLFRQDIDDTIFSQRGFNQFGVVTSGFKNIDNVTTTGIEFLVAAEDVIVEGLSVDANLSWADAEITKNAAVPASEGGQVPRVPEWKANTSVRYRPTDEWLVAAGWRFQSEPYTDLENTLRCNTYTCTSAFSILDLKVSRYFETFKVSLGVDNVTDQRAWVHHPYSGRAVLLEVSWTGGSD